MTNTLLTDRRFFVFDVESIGLYGEGFAAAFVVVTADGEEVDSASYVCLVDRAAGSEADRAWVKAHVTIPDDALRCADPSDVRYALWKAMAHWKAREALIFADCGAPVEAAFLAARMTDVFPPSPSGGPYPFHDVATVLLCAGLDPLATYDRLPDELPAHNPLADARQSARLLVEALREIQAAMQARDTAIDQTRLLPAGYLGNINGPGSDPDTV